MTDWYDESIANDRLAFAVFVALMLHAALILGVGFTREQHDPLPQSLEITLAQRDDRTAPEQADFLAAVNQRASGSARERLEPTTPAASAFAAATVQPVLPGGVTASPEPQSDSSSVQARDASQPIAEPPPRQPQPDRSAADAGAAAAPSNTEIASLMARLAAQQQAYARMPRVQRLTAVSTRAADDAAYLFHWKQRIETIGNQNYPPEAKRRRLYGDLRLLVALRPDGSVVEVRVLQSSGQPLLDDAAARIVQIAAPFEPFPDSLRARVDVLQIIRTWQFRADRLSATE